MRVSDATPATTPSSTKPTGFSCGQKYNPTCTHPISHNLLTAKMLIQKLGAFCNLINTRAVKELIDAKKTDQTLANEPG
jgi:hypothetical protein